MVHQPLGLALPDYHIQQYTEQIYKIIKFKRPMGNLEGFYYARNSENTVKHDSSYSRACRCVLDYALCNSWDYFFTGTIDKSKFDRFDLDTFDKKFKQWIRDQRKKYIGHDFAFLVVPEHHDDGAWHLHGLLRGLPFDRLQLFDPVRHPLKLCNGVYRYWEDYNAKFGFSSVAPIKSPVRCAFYIQKYVSKDLSKRAEDIGKHLYSHSQGLNSSFLKAEIFGSRPDLDKYLTNNYEFCRTGITHLDDNLDWTFALDFDTAISLASEDLQSYVDIDPVSLDPEVYEQLEMGGFL